VFDGTDVPSRGIQIWINVPSAPEPFGSVAAGSIEIDAFALVGAICVELAAAFAFWVVGALWLDVWDWPLDEPPPPWAWLEPCPTAFAFAAPAVDCEVFVWVTAPSSPGLLFRMTMFAFRGLT